MNGHSKWRMTEAEAIVVLDACDAFDHRLEQRKYLLVHAVPIAMVSAALDRLGQDH